jgi:enediyne biosynthesis protein E4
MYGHAFAAGDMTGDGWYELFDGTFADRPDDTYRVRGATGPSPDRLLAGGPDGFAVHTGFPAAFERTSGAVMADLTGDGQLELVAARNPRRL